MKDATKQTKKDEESKNLPLSMRSITNSIKRWLRKRTGGKPRRRRVNFY